MNDKITRAEWRWVVAVSLLVVAFSTIPYGIGYLAQTSDLRFAGTVFDVEDYHSHLAKMWQGYRGEWRYRLLFTTEEHRGAYLQTFYVALGHLARLSGLSVPLTYHLARIATGVFLLLVVYRFFALFAAGEVRRVAFLLAVISSGLGWLVEIVRRAPPGGISPVDFWLTDGNTFFALFTFPHFSAATALLLALYGVLLRLTEATERTFVSHLPKVVLALLLSWGLGIIHPYALLLADLVPVLYVGWFAVNRRCLPKHALAVLLLVGMAQVPLLLYDYHVFSAEPVFRAWAAQNVTLSPPPLYYLLGYGLVAVLAVWGIPFALRASRRVVFLLLWVVAAFTLAYLPWALQRRFVEGIHVAFCILAGYGLLEGLMSVLARPLRWVACFLHYSPHRLQWLIQMLFLMVAALSNLYLVSAYSLAAAARYPSLFHTADQVAAVEWLGAYSAWDETVLAAHETGNWIAGAIGHRVVLGHWAETVDYESKRVAVARFYAAGTPDAGRLALLKGWGVVYVFHGPEERALGDFDPAGAAWLGLVFQRDDVTVYQVRESP